jgi:DNA-binding SARP family transcriptional activator
MMAKQPGYQNSGYKLFDAGFAALAELEKGKLCEWGEEEREKLYDSFRAAFEKLEDELEDCAKNVSFPRSAFSN